VVGTRLKVIGNLLLFFEDCRKEKKDQNPVMTLDFSTVVCSDAFLLLSSWRRRHFPFSRMGSDCTSKKTQREKLDPKFLCDFSFLEACFRLSFCDAISSSVVWCARLKKQFASRRESYMFPKLISEVTCRFWRSQESKQNSSDSL
jgi:hypothetical protein